MRDRRSTRRWHWDVANPVYSFIDSLKERILQATGNRRCVLEDGADKVNSDDEEIPDMQPGVELNMYTPEMDPLKGPIKLTQSQAAAQKAAAQALKSLKSPPRSQSPMQTGSSDDDDPNGSQYI
jgi:hypothetical protein